MRLITFFLLPSAVYAGSISGIIYFRIGEAQKPCARVEVVARAAYGSQVVQSSVTDAQGHYTLRDIDGRFSLSVSMPGYFARSVAGGERALVIDLAQNERLDNADFAMLPGGVITGRITDPQGSPMDGVLVTVSRSSRSRGRNAASLLAKTDDRGIYRVFGLEPGRYSVFARVAQWAGGARPVEIYYRETIVAGRADLVEVVAGGETTGIDLVLKAAPVFRLAGKVGGINPEDVPRVRIGVATAAGSPHSSVSYSAPLDRGAAFNFDLPAGPYTVAATMQTGSRIIASRKIDLTANITDLLLQPISPGSLSGRVVFAAAQSHQKPVDIVLRAVETGGTHSVHITARAPQYRFDSGPILPGTYTLELASAGAGYITKIGDGASSAAREVLVGEGGNTAVQIEIGLDLAQISGVVQASSGNPIAHAKVALAKAGTTPMDFQAVEADQKGRFLFPELKPGEYVLCAWPHIDDDALDTPATWEQAGEAAKRLNLGPNALMEGVLFAVGNASGAKK